MERIYTWIPKKHYQMLLKESKRTGESQYKVAQKLIVEGLDRQEAEKFGVIIAYWFLCYSLIITSLLLVI